MKEHLLYITNFVEGIMTVFPSIIVSELAAVIIGEDPAAASETAIITDGINIITYISILFK
jgi:hypothetical protein